MTVKPTMKPGVTLEELVDEAARLSKSLAAFGQLPCNTIYNGKRYYITDKGKIANEFHGERYYMRWSFGSALADFSLPASIIKKMIINGSSRFNIIEGKIAKAYETYPEVALESTLESKDKRQVVKDLYRAKVDELSAMISLIPTRTMQTLITFKIVINGRYRRNYFAILNDYDSTYTLHIRNDTFRDMINFINDFDEIRMQIEGTISKILKEVQ